MKTKVLPLLFTIALTLISTGCTINRHVNSVSPGTRISKIYIEENNGIHMSGLMPEVVTQLRMLGFVPVMYSGQPPEDAVHTMKVTANWKWDMAMYLSYFQATLSENGRTIGGVEYDARKGSGNMGKFGHTAEKIRPLLLELMKGAKRGQPGATALGYK